MRFGLQLRRKIVEQHIERLDSMLRRGMDTLVGSNRSEFVTYGVNQVARDVVEFYAQHENGSMRTYTVTVTDGQMDDDVEYECFNVYGDNTDGGYMAYTRVQKDVRELIERLVLIRSDLDAAESELEELDDAINFDYLMGGDEDDEPSEDIEPVYLANGVKLDALTVDHVSEEGSVISGTIYCDVHGEKVVTEYHLHNHGAGKQWVIFGLDGVIPGFSPLTALLRKRYSVYLYDQPANFNAYSVIAERAIPLSTDTLNVVD